MEKIALCIGKKNEVCYLMYGGEHHLLNTVEMRPNFEEAPSTRVWQDGDESVVQVQLPIFFVSKPEDVHLPDFRVFYSPVLDGSSLSAEDYCFSDDVSIKPWVQYEAFLTLRGWEIGIPRWKLQSLKDIVMESKKLSAVSKHVSTFHFSHLITQKEQGFVLKLFDDYCFVLILCLRDGQLAIATNKLTNNIFVGDIVHFCCREVDRPVLPSISSSKLFVVDLSLNKEPSLPVGLSSNFSLKSLQGDKLFELRFPVSNSMLSPTFTVRGSIHVDNFGVLLDPDGKLGNHLSLVRVGQLIIAQARLCLVPERQSPLWFIVNVICEEKEEEYVKEEEANVGDEQSHGYDFMSEDNQNKENETEIGDEHDDEFDVIDGGFGGGWKKTEKKRFEAELKREEKSCVEESLNASIGESSISSSESIRSATENLPMSDGIALFIQIRSYEWILALYDKRLKKFAQSCCTLIKSLPLGADHRSPIPGSWFQICFAFYDTHQNQRAQKHILISSMFPAQSDGLPMQINPSNKEVWTMVINGKFDCALKGGTSRTNNKPPIPVTKVFSRANSEAQIENQRNIGRPIQQNSTVFTNGAFNRRTTVVPSRNDNNMDKTRLERYFCVDYEMAGIVVGCLRASAPEMDAKNTFWIWPFCTGTQTPRELTLCTSLMLEHGTWIKFNAECYQRGEIDEFKELAHWLDTHVNEGPKAPKVCLECSIQIPADYDPDSEVHNEIWTCRFKPKNNHIPFIKKLIPTDELKSYLKQHRGKFGVFARLEYRREFGGNGRTVGYWQIAKLLTGMNKKPENLKD
ncbi:hypothetical protein niasHS_014863 [Heterodera schachtii]|uniref:Uncharacterized protein n=1 Tax=Heterodera schachtii TaxID=97005 RepID=A0ABD2IIX7_HETSC